MYLRDQLPTLTSYEGALNHYHKVVPLRSGAEKGKRPLGAVRRYTRSIIWLDSNTVLNPNGKRDGNTDLNPNPNVVLSYYGHDLIKFTPDNHAIVNTCGWPSVSTLGFLRDTLSPKFQFKRLRGRIYYRNAEGFHLLPTDGKSAVTINLNTGEAVGGGHIDTYVANKAALRAARAPFKEFITYARNCLAMSVTVNNMPSFSARLLYADRSSWSRNYKGPDASVQRELRDEVFALATRDASLTEEEVLERFYQAFEHIAASASTFLRFPQKTYVCGRKRFDEFFDNLLKLHYAETVFTPVTVSSPMPKIPTTSNNWFVHWFEDLTK